ncbi:MOSC domain-containing protein isoform 1 [Cladophialophora immunda]|nr:MOSC domain-containing protein isoform 1 [Cladophialophora immunda]
MWQSFHLTSLQAGSWKLHCKCRGEAYSRTQEVWEQKDGFHARNKCMISSCVSQGSPSLGDATASTSSAKSDDGSGISSSEPLIRAYRSLLNSAVSCVSSIISSISTRGTKSMLGSSGSSKSDGMSIPLPSPSSSLSAISMIFRFLECAGGSLWDRWESSTGRSGGSSSLSVFDAFALSLGSPEIWFPDPTDEEPSTDRGWMVVRYPRIPTGRFSLISRLFIWLGIASEGKSFRVPLVPGENHQYPTENVTVWKDNPKWLNYGVHLPNDFQSFIKASNPVTLFRVDPNAYREVFRCAPRKDQLGYQPVVGFADAYPVHLLNTTSVRDIALRVKQEIPRFTARRFRANILIDGPGAYNEDDWKMIRIGSHIFFCACHTVRCRLPNVDPDTAVMHPVEPDKTLKSFRCIDEGDPLNACLGLQLVPAAAGSFRIHVGDEVEVLERGHHKYIKQ